MTKHHSSLAAASILIAALSASPAQATDGYFLNGIGAKAKGSAGVAIAQPQDALSIAANPAAATEVGGRLDVGVEFFIPNRGATISGNGETVEAIPLDRVRDILRRHGIAPAK